jgi:nickel/cobalt exporter
MKITNLLPLPLIFAGFLCAHPMGSSSVSHYSRLTVTPGGVELLYVLDLAELPTMDLLRQWGEKVDMQKHAENQAREWATHLAITSDGRGVMPSLGKTSVSFSEGSGGHRTMRVAMNFTLAVATGNLFFEDRNYPGRAGWKEIVIVPAAGVSISTASQAAKDLSQALTAYPKEAPPQDLRAKVEWMAGDQKKSAVIVPIEQPALAIPAAPAQQPAGRGDYLSTLLGNRNLTFGMILTGVLVAFGLGAMHAMSPGHGKTIVAAYLVGSRGTMKHALFLGGMVTFTHTISVFLLGLATLFLSRYVVPDRIYPVLGAISGLSIVVIGLSLLIKRGSKIWGHGHGHHHHHDHDHGHDHGHDHDHHHGPGGHTHVPEGDITMGSLIALGASGGLVPCPSALVLLLTSIAIGRVAFGLVLLTAFSLGLAAVLMAIGCAVLFAKNVLPESSRISTHPFFRYVPVASAAFIVCVGFVMTGVSLGWVNPARF